MVKMIFPLRSNFKILSTKVFSKISSFGDTRSQNKMIVGYCLHTEITSQALTDIISLVEHILCKVCIYIFIEMMSSILVSIVQLLLFLGRKM